MAIREPVSHIEPGREGATLPAGRHRRWGPGFDDGLMGVALLAGAANVIMELARPGVGYGVKESRVESERPTGTRLSGPALRSPTSRSRPVAPRSRRRRTGGRAKDPCRFRNPQRFRRSVAASRRIRHWLSPVRFRHGHADRGRPARASAGSETWRMGTHRYGDRHPARGQPVPGS